METLNAKLLNKFITDLYKTTKIKDITINNASSIFLNNVKLTKRSGTLTYYMHIMSKWSSYFQSINLEYISQINNDIINNYIRINSTLVKNATINKAITALKTMLNYLEEQELITNVNIKVKKLKEEQPEIKIVELNTIKQVLTYLKTEPLKNQLIFKILLSTGIRRTELIHIKRSNIDFNDYSIYLERTKTGNARYIFLTLDVIEVIKVYISQTKSIWLFCDSVGNQSTTSTIDHIFLKIKKDLKIKNLSPHKLRHTYATMLLENNTDIETVRLLLGHSSYEMTKRYLHVKNKKLKEKSTKNNPLAYLNTMTDI